MADLDRRGWRQYFDRLFCVKQTIAPASAEAVVVKPVRQKFKVVADAVARAMLPGLKKAAAKEDYYPFKPYKPLPGVIGDHGMAMDAATDASVAWAQQGISGAYAEGQQFLGYPELSLLAQRPEYRVVFEIIATEMTRKWIKLVSLDKTDKSDKIADILAEMDRLGVRDAFKEIAEHDGAFGRGHLFLDFGEQDGLELDKSIGDGGADDGASKSKVGTKKPLKAIRTVEAVWCYPSSYNASNPLSPTWYKPDSWYVMGKQVHATRLLTFVGREVPDLLKPAYAFGGLSTTQMAKPYVNNWLDVRQGVTDIVKAFSTWVLLTDAADIISGGDGDSFYKRLDIFNATRDNRGIMALDKEKEDFKNVSAPLGTLDKLQAQAQEHMASVSRIPLVKLTGITPSGLNASSEGEMECFEDTIEAYQQALFRTHLTTVINFIQLSLFDEVDPQIGFEFEKLRELSEKELAEMRKLDADTGAVLVQSKAISSLEERARVTSDPEGPYAGVDAAQEVVQILTEGEKADVATKVAAAVATLVSEAIIDTPMALKELQASAKVTGFCEGISDSDIAEAEAAPPAPSELGAPEFQQAAE